MRKNHEPGDLPRFLLGKLSEGKITVQKKYNMGKLCLIFNYALAINSKVYSQFLYLTLIKYNIY